MNARTSRAPSRRHRTGAHAFLRVALVPWLLAIAASPASAGLAVETLPGAARDVAVGANGTVFVVAPAREGDGKLYRWEGGRWAPWPGQARRVAVDPRGDPWVVNAAGEVFRWSGRRWQQVPGEAREIAVGADGTVFAVGTGAADGGFALWRWAGSAPGGGSWEAWSGAAERIAVDPRGRAWIVNDAGRIFRWDRGRWLPVDGSATDIAVGPDGAVYVIGTDARETGSGLWRWRGGRWLEEGIGARSVAVGPDRTVWFTDADDRVHRGIATDPRRRP